MRKMIFAAAAAAIASATPAFASDSGNTQITAELTPSCSIVEQSSAIALAGVDVPVSGTFKYTCNFVGQPELNFTSANGGVYNPDNGTSLKKYGIYLNDAAPSGPPSTWLQSSATPQSYPNITMSDPANSTEEPYFQVGLTEALDVAGSYSDTLTIDINP